MEGSRAERVPTHGQSRVLGYYPLNEQIFSFIFVLCVFLVIGDPATLLIVIDDTRPIVGKAKTVLKRDSSMLCSSTRVWYNFYMNS